MGQQNFKTFINKRSSVTIIINEVDSYDKAYAAVGLYTLLEELNKKPTVIVPQQNEKQEYILPFKEINIALNSKVAPLSYVVSIDYTKNDIEKITHDTDEKEGKIKFHIYPSDKNFSFDNVEFNKEGSAFEGAILMGVNSPEDLGELYTENKKLLKTDDVYCLGNEGDYSKRITQNLKYNENGKQTRLSSEIAQNLLNGVLFSSDLFTEEKKLDKNYEIVDFLVNQGASLSEAIYKAYRTNL